MFQEATELGKKARELKKAADALRHEERNGAKGRKWRKNVKSVEKVTQSVHDYCHYSVFLLSYFSSFKLSFSCFFNV